MALASDIIRRAYRETNLIPIGQQPTANQSAEALESLNGIILSTIGNEAGVTIEDITIGGDFDESDLITEYVPSNIRLVCHLDDPIEVGLHPKPKEGTRFAIVDSGGNMSTATITINANGRSIEGAADTTCDTDYMARQWMYRADTANWVRISQLLTSDDMPFPAEFDDYFVIMTAMRIDPRFSQALTSETLQTLNRARSQIRARYSPRIQVESDLKPNGLATDRTFTAATTDDEFSAGRPYPYL